MSSFAPKSSFVHLQAMKKPGIALLLLFFSIICLERALGQTIKEVITKQEKALVKADDREKISIYITLSKIKNSNLLPGSVADARQAYSLAGKTDDPELFVRAILQLTEALMEDKNGVDSAYLLLKEAKEKISETGISIPPEYYYCNAKYHLFKKNISATIENGEMAEKMAISKSDFFTCSKSRILLAKAFKEQNNRTLFLKYLKLAAESLAISKDKYNCGAYFISVSIMFGDAGFPELATQNALKGLSICESTYDSIPLGFLYANLSGLFGLNDKAKGLEYLQKSSDIFHKLNYKKGISYISNMLGMFYYGEKEYSKSVEHFKTTLALSAEINDWQTACFASNNIAEVMINLKRFKEADQYLKEAYEYAVKSGDDRALAVYHSTRALYFSGIQNPAKCIEEYQVSLVHSYKLKDANFVTGTLKAIADYYHATGNEKQANIYYNKYISARDSVANLAQINNALEIRDKYMNGEESGVAEKSDSSYRNYFLIIAAVLILALLLISIYFINKNAEKRRAKVNAQVAEVVLQQVDTIKEPKTPRLQLNEKLQKEIWDKLIYLMETEHLYRNADLSLNELAEKLDSNTTYVSKVINDVADSNFTTFINRYRIKEACKLLTDPESAHLSIEGIAYTVGFHSKSAFNGAFKKNTGKTPSEYALLKNGDS